MGRIIMLGIIAIGMIGVFLKANEMTLMDTPSDSLMPSSEISISSLPENLSFPEKLSSPAPSKGMKNEQPRQPQRLYLRGIELLATFILNNEPRAVIKSTGGGKTVSYRLGDKIKGAQIIDISLYNVVFLKEGKRHTLFVKKKIDHSEPIQELSSEDRLVNKNALFRELPGVNQLVKDVGFIPVVENGKISGLRITRFSENGIFAKSGIKQGDIIRSVNGKTLTGLQQVVELVKMVQSGDLDHVNMEIERKPSSNKPPRRKILSYIVF